MKKKVMSLLTVLCMSFSVIVPAGAVCATEYGTDAAVATNIVREMVAQYPLAERIEDANCGIIDENVGEEIREAVTFSISSDYEDSLVTANNLMEDGETDVHYSIKNLGEVVVNGKSIGTLYSATGTEKTKSGSQTRYGVEAYMSVVWIDNWGADNVLVEVSGGWNRNGHYIHRRVLQYGAHNANGVGESEYLEGVSDPYRYTDINFHGLTISAVSYAEIWEDQPSSSGEPIRRQFNFGVSPTIFD